MGFVLHADIILKGKIVSLLTLKLQKDKNIDERVPVIGVSDFLCRNH